MLNTALMQDLLAEDFSGFEGDNAPITVPGEITTITANEWVTTSEEIIIGGQSVLLGVRYRFINPILSSLALRQTDAVTRTGRIDFTATVASKREMQVETTNGWISLEDFICNALRIANPNLTKSNDHILLDLKHYGIDPSGTLPMYLQHLGANRESFEQIANQFMSMGAVNNTSQVAGRAQGTRSKLLSSYRVNEGVPIHTLEISKVDRSQSTSGTGFVGFLDGFWNTFTQVVKMDRARTAAKKILTTDASNAAAAEEEARIRNIFSNARTLRAFRNWGGTTVTTSILDDSVSYYAQQLPCGRFSVRSPQDQAVHTWSVWSTRTINSDEMPTLGSESSGDEASAPVTGDAEPF